MKVLFLILSLFLSSISFAQNPNDLPPVFLDNINLRHYVILHSDYDNNKTNYASVYTNVGFGRINGNPNAPNHNWKIRDDNGTPDNFKDDIPIPYVWFKIENTTNGQMDDYWITTPNVWNSYLSDKDVIKLRNNSWNFQSFLILSSYNPPPPPTEDIIWEQKTDYVVFGYTSISNIIIVKKNFSGSQEWTIRGDNPAAGDSWNIAADKLTAMKNATEAHKGN